MKHRLILNSKGFNTQTGAKQLRDALQKNCEKDLSTATIFVVSHPDYDADLCINALIRDNLVEILGFQPANILFSDWNTPNPDYEPDIVYVSEALDTFFLLDYMNDLGITDFIKRLFKTSLKNLVYIGSSAGAAIAGDDILLARYFEQGPQIPYMQSENNRIAYIRKKYKGLHFYDGALIPHYTDEQLSQFEDLLLEEERSSYSHIFAVSNENVLVWDMTVPKESIHEIPGD